MTLPEASPSGSTASPRSLSENPVAIVHPMVYATQDVMVPSAKRATNDTTRAMVSSPNLRWHGLTSKEES